MVIMMIMMVTILAQLFEGRFLALNPGLNLTRLSFFCSKAFLG